MSHFLIGFLQCRILTLKSCNITLPHFDLFITLLHLCDIHPRLVPLIDLLLVVLDGLVVLGDDRAELFVQYFGLIGEL